MRDLARHAVARDRIIFTTWHSQYNAAVEETRARLAGRTIRRLAITWKEDVRRWHPGQDWIWDPAGFGVFDPGINALSILTRIMPAPVFVRAATLTTPANRAMPIAASLEFSSPALAGPAEEARMTADFDWRQTGDQTWDFAIDLDDGSALRLTGGGTTLTVDGETVVEGSRNEYDRIYARFASLLDAGTSLVDMAPFELVADAFMVGRRIETEPFSD